MALTGGLRDRMILESIQRLIEAELTTLGWFNPGRAHSDITLKQGFPDEKENIPPNTIAFSNGDGRKIGGELGSGMTEWATPLFIDMFSDNEAVAIEVMGDIVEYLRLNPSLPVRDYGTVGEPIDFHMVVDTWSLENRRSQRPTNPWQRHWRVVAFEVHDERPA